MNVLRFIIHSALGIIFLIGYMTFIEYLTDQVGWAILAGLILWKLWDAYDAIFNWAWPKRSTYDTP